MSTTNQAPLRQFAATFQIPDQCEPERQLAKLPPPKIEAVDFREHEELWMNGPHSFSLLSFCSADPDVLLNSSGGIIPSITPDEFSDLTARRHHVAAAGIVAATTAAGGLGGVPCHIPGRELLGRLFPPSPSSGRPATSKSCTISSSSSWPTLGIVPTALRRRGTTSFTNISSIMGLMVLVSFRLLVERRATTTGPAREPSVAIARVGFLRPPGWRMRVRGDKRMRRGKSKRVTKRLGRTRCGADGQGALRQNLMTPSGDGIAVVCFWSERLGEGCRACAARMDAGVFRKCGKNDHPAACPCKRMEPWKSGRMGGPLS